jgi:EAL domain-containing protein (putative c-di-GMP-specific phosphodiesterase class I)
MHDEHSPARLMLESELRQAIVNGDLILHYQPEIDVCSGRIDRVESLVRWPHPVRGLVPPDQFISLAEEIGLINALTQWVLETALRQCQAWTRAGYRLGVAVNLSMRTLHDASFPDTVVWLLRRYEVDPALVTLEITESALMAKPAQAQAVLTRLAALGVHIAIDDFGTGYSSLGYLKHLPVDEIKIDKSFVRGMTADAKDTAIVASINSLSHHLGLRVVAEGVETSAEWEHLAALGCDLVQGYHVSRPLPAAQLEEWLASSPWGLPRIEASGEAV